MAVPTRLDLECYEGDNWSHTVQFDDDEGNPLDLTGATWSGKVRVRPNAYAEETASFTVNIASQASGILVLSLPSATTTDMPKDGYYDLERTDSKETMLRGTFVVKRQIT